MYRLLNTWEFDIFFLRQSRPSVETYIRDGEQYIFHNYVGHLFKIIEIGWHSTKLLQKTKSVQFLQTLCIITTLCYGCRKTRRSFIAVNDGWWLCTRCAVLEHYTTVIVTSVRVTISLSWPIPHNLSPSLTSITRSASLTVQSDISSNISARLMRKYFRRQFLVAGKAVFWTRLYMCSESVNFRQGKR